MELQISSDGTIILREINALFFTLLRGIVQHAGSTHPQVEERFFPSPTRSSNEGSLMDDWKSLIQPELNATFQAAREIVRTDLRLATEKEGEFFLTIPPNHADAWLNALNQARLALAEEHHFGEAELSAEMPPEISDERSYALLQIHFYGFLQEWLVRSQDGRAISPSDPLP